MSKYTYLSGPMTGYADFNTRAFTEAAAWLRSQGYDVWNPAEHDGPQVQEYAKDRVLPEDLYQEILQQDLGVIEEKCDSIVLLPGWAYSRGAKAELRLALNLGLKVWDYMDLRSPIFSCSQE